MVEKARNRAVETKKDETVIAEALTVTYNFLSSQYSHNECKEISDEILNIAKLKNPKKDWFQRDQENPCSYDDLQKRLSSLNEKESIRKLRGVYYTPKDLVRFILFNAVRGAFGELGEEGLSDRDVSGFPYSVLCFQKTVYDPTCGTGEFLVEALEMKLQVLDRNREEFSQEEFETAVNTVVGTIHGNDVNRESVVITKIRLYLCILQRYGFRAGLMKSLPGVLNSSFTTRDFVQKRMKPKKRYDIIVGNPPYVEDAKSNLELEYRYGNIYANVLDNAARYVSPEGSIGFVIPLSYVSTPRMAEIRRVLFRLIPEQYILSYNDRPDCLFTAVHQKLCILFGRKRKVDRKVFTGNYHYWYREERGNLFRSPQVIRNRFLTDGYIPKLGTQTDCCVYSKILAQPRSFADLVEDQGAPLYLNMRATFWIKAFRQEHLGGEYKVFCFQTDDMADYAMCLLNSSLFWWYWICVSDCWHITGKELRDFFVMLPVDFERIRGLAANLEQRLEETKRYVGTVQTEYEYKHKECVKEIHQIDDYINELYGLTQDESLYIKYFAHGYRVSKGVE